MATRVLILGAGFGGLELATTLSEALGEEVEVTLIDKGDAFVFGYSKLDVMFGRARRRGGPAPLRDFAKPGVRLLRETVVAIDPEARAVTTDAGVHEADYLVVALGADYDMEATPGLAEGGQRVLLGAPAPSGWPSCCPSFTRGPGRDRRLRGALQVPAGAERGRAAAARPSHRARRPRRVRDPFVMPLAEPGPALAGDLGGAAEPPSPSATSSSSPARRIASLDPDRRVVVLDDGSELPYDLFLGVPKHRAPDVVVGERHGRRTATSRSTRATLRDGVPRRLRGRRRRHRRRAEGRRLRRGRGAGRRRRADRPGARAASTPDGYDGRGSCYIEFGAGRVGRVDVDFLSGPKPTGAFQQPSAALVAEKEEFGSSRRARWFGGG